MVETSGAGRAPYWEEVEVGRLIAGPGLTVTDAHLVTWAGLTGDIVSIHLDDGAARAGGFRSRVAHGPFTLSASLGMLTQTGVLDRVRAWLGVDEVRALVPVYPGDTIRPYASVVQSRTTRDDTVGLWTLLYQVTNQTDDTVMTFKSSFLVERRPQ